MFKPVLPRCWDERRLEAPKPTKGTLALVVGIVLASALATQLLGIRALFGSFVAGLIIPAGGGFRAKLGVRIENISSVLLLPVFFAFSGLRTEIGLLHGRSDWMICLLIIAVASVGKLGGSSFAARLTGMGWRDSFRLGALMNTRGLMELIALNLGYDLHILSRSVFSMLVLMALLTTVMTGPLLSLIRCRIGLESDTYADRFWESPAAMKPLRERSALIHAGSRRLRWWRRDKGQQP